MTYPADPEDTVQIWKERDQFIAHAMPLDVMSSGPTVEAAREALEEAVSLLLETSAEGRYPGGSPRKPSRGGSASAVGQEDLAEESEASP